MAITIEPELVEERIRDYAADWTAIAASTERADRPRAEAAVAALYRAAGMAPPDIVWVPSPAAGVHSHAVASLTRTAVASRYATGAIGSGWGREWNALAEPFPIEPRWANRLTEALTARTPRDAGLDGTDRLWASVRNAVRREPARSADPSTVPSDPDAIDAIAATLLGPTWDQMRSAVGTSIARDTFAVALRSATTDLLDIPDRMPNAIQAMQPGQFDAVTPRLAAVRDVLGRPLWRRMQDRAQRLALIDARLELARSAGPWWALDTTAIISERPLAIHRDDRGRLHGTDRPAMAYGDGFEVWAWHGVLVDRSAIVHPERITAASIDAEVNAEVRRALIERFGAERFIREGGAELVHEDATGRLWRKALGDPPRRWGFDGGLRQHDEPITMVEVVNSTPEPDGSRKTYFLRVPPHVRTAQEAVAWTFKMAKEVYAPVDQT